MLSQERWAGNEWGRKKRTFPSPRPALPPPPPQLTPHLASLLLPRTLFVSGEFEFKMALAQSKWVHPLAKMRLHWLGDN